MARRLRACPPGVPQHIIQRGNNRQACFASEEDLAAYAHWLDEAASKYSVSLHAWVFMYHWSSYAANGQAKPARLWTPHNVWLRLGLTHHERAAHYRATFCGHIDAEQLAVIGAAVNKGLALGDERFRREVEQLTGVQVSPSKAGRKRSPKDTLANRQELLL